jgi:hypothetical protein
MPDKVVVCTICGDFAIASWNQFGMKIGTCQRHAELLTSKDDLRSITRFFNGTSPWNWEGKWYLPKLYQ